MERDFMGLAVKQEIPEEQPTDPAMARISAILQRSFSNKALPQYLSFKNAQGNTPKTGFDSLASAGLVTITTSHEAVDSNYRPYTAVTQKNLMLEKQGITNYTMTTYPPHKIGTNSVQQSHEVRVLPVANQTHQISVSTRNMHGRQPLISPAGQNLISIINQNPARGAQISSSISILPNRNGVVGTTELRGAPKTSAGPAQLTIFYAGSVSVYDNISPEKAQAIMLLAGNAQPAGIPSTTSTASPVQRIPKSSSVDAFVGNKCHRTTSPSFSSPIPITTHGASQSIGVSNNTNQITMSIRSIGVLTNSPSNKTEPSKVVRSQESHPPSHTLSAVPQARKASLARFLEKRKERILSASPYDNSKQSSQYSTPGSSSWSFFVNSSGSSTVLPATI
ncbi:PREDICTED: protein TIFY 6B-like [Nicotiana attenuata]|uniref:Protein TIFY n=1 Tax=Nicotiana attenuata TaxID=49451 RepID=I3WTA5_NICAT|nr:PREDICTED: protein TIFY 6B-like [Nicotiana attenuata]AFL46172.1 jasmonate ZIM domain protein g [Nicotiana attenuata]OIT21055.1 protein tify 6b [Nicotiana attenuata]